MKSKEVIFNEHSFNALGSISPSKSFCLDAMDEYAKEVCSDLLREMKRYLPVLEQLEKEVGWWNFLMQGTGIATLNGYRNAIDKTEKLLSQSKPIIK